MRAINLVLAMAAVTACAQAPMHISQGSVVPGTIEVTVRQEGSAVVVSGVRGGGVVRLGDAVLRYNGQAVGSPRAFYRLVVESAPGSVARLEVLREGGVLTLEVPVRELDMTPQV